MSSAPPSSAPNPSEPAAVSSSRQSLFAGIAWVAAVFGLLLGCALVQTYLDARAHDPFQSPQMWKLKEQLRQQPTNTPLKEQIRQLDWTLRERHFLQADRMHSGAILLLGAVAVFIWAAGQARRPAGQPTAPSTPQETEPRLQQPVNRWMVAGVGSALGVLLFLVSLKPVPSLPQRDAEIEKLVAVNPAPAQAAAPDAASAEELRANWARFRGMDGGLSSAFASGPAQWNAQSGNGILWKVPNPVVGFNSPIIWGERLFFSGGDAAKREVVCLDLKNGQTLWRAEVKGTAPSAPGDIPDSTGYAASSMATDGRRVYAIFANGDLGAFTLDGKTAWTHSFGALKNAYGHATSLATWQDRLLVQLDQGDSDEGKSKLYALDGRTGQIVWQKPRKVGGSWASPIVIQSGAKAQLITLAVPWATAYNPVDGTELWHVDCISGEVTPSPAFGGGLVLAPSPGEKITAIRPDGSGDVTKTHVAWTTEENVPDVTSPVANDELVFAVTTPGTLSCFNLKDGKKVWEQDLGMEFHASPLLAGGRLYLFSQKGVAVVVETGRQFKELYRTDLGDDVHASPAVAGNRMVVRATKYVWCLEGVK